MKPHKKLLFKKHDLFDLTDDVNHKSLLKMEIHDIVNALEKPDAQDLHILGLTVYFTQVNLIELNQAHEFFFEALEKDPNYHIARLYSAHCYHDKKAYKEAIENYLLVDAEFIKNEYAIWRFVKLQEQLGFCFHQLGKTSVARKYFKTVLLYYQQHDYEDLIDPLEIYQCLDKDDEIYKSLNNIEDSYHTK